MTGIPALTVSTLGSMEEYRAFREANRDEYRRRLAHELALIPGDEPFTTPGYCHVCRAPADFATDFLHSGGERVEGRRIPNWRERVVCPGCGLNNRVRARLGEDGAVDTCASRNTMEIRSTRPDASPSTPSAGSCWTSCANWASSPPPTFSGPTAWDISARNSSCSPPTRTPQKNKERT